MFDLLRDFVVNIPPVCLENGCLVFISGRPVYIDNQGTYHYGIGKSMAEIFKKGMEFQAETSSKDANLKGRVDQHKIDSSSISAVPAGDQVESVLSGTLENSVISFENDSSESEKSTNDSLIFSGQNSPAGITGSILKKQEDDALRSDQPTRELLVEKDPFGKPLAEVNKELQSKNGVAVLSESNKAEEEEGVASSQHALDQDFNGHEVLQPACPFSISKDLPLDISKLTAEQRLQWACKSSVEDPTFTIPYQVNEDIKNTIFSILENFPSGYPKFKHLIETLIANPRNKCLDQFKKYNRKQANLLISIRNVLYNKTSELSYKQALFQLREELDPVLFKSVREYLNKELAKLYPTVEECLNDGLIERSKLLVCKNVRDYSIKNKDSTVALTSLLQLSKVSGAESSPLKYAFELVDKNSEFLSDLELVILDLIQRLKKIQADTGVSAYIRLSNMKALSQEARNVVFPLLAEAFVLKSLAVSKVDQPMLEKWFECVGQDICKQAIKDFLKSDFSSDTLCSLAVYVFNKVLFISLEKSSVSGSPDLYIFGDRVSKVFNDDVDLLFKEDELRALILAFCKEWNGKYVELWEVWEPLIKGASSSDRAQFIQWFLKGVERSEYTETQTLILLEAFHKDLKENSAAWENSAYQYIKQLVFFLQKKDLSNTEQNYRDSVSLYLLNIWSQLDFKWKCWESIMENNGLVHFLCGNFRSLNKWITHSHL